MPSSPFARATTISVEADDAAQHISMTTDRAALVAFHKEDVTDLDSLIDAARHGDIIAVHVVVKSGDSSTAQHQRIGETCIEIDNGSAFYGSSLDALLQDLDISTILLAGSSSDKRLVATAVDGQSRGYAVHAVVDGKSNRADTLLQELARQGLIASIVSVTKLLSALQGAAVAKRPSAVERLKAIAPALEASFQDHTLWSHSRSIDDLYNEAERIDALGVDAGPLAGTFFAVKENIDVQGWTSTAMQIRPGVEPVPRSSNAPVVERLRNAGAILVGKNSMDLFATGICGVRCPGGHPLCATDPARVPGGSSSGCAVAVAKGVVDFAIGTDTAGSVRMPAALNGIIGHKPSMSALSIRGVVACQPLLDCVGIFARGVALVRKVWIVARGYDVDDERSDLASDGPRLSHRLAGLGVDRLDRNIVVAVPPLGFIDEKCEEPYREHFRLAIEKMERCGCTVRYLTMAEFQPYIRAGELVYGGLVAERYAVLSEFLTRQEDWDALIPSTRQFLERAVNISAKEYTSALHERLSLQAYMRSFWKSKPSGIDVLMVPTATDHATVAEATASTADDLRVNARIGLFTYAVNVLDLCGVAVPISTIAARGTEPARQFGVTLIAPRYDDGFLLSLTDKVLSEQSSS